ncbi:MaoC/PaaZ C-terminal domain-containing protein [Enterobacillus tribolii]|uniref:MaoC dehydratase-like protein n=1 Tax=Enterobacillus tribolii TaxID=1487935 RepID=A0A370R2B7_9GAMM|nr:MaoC/PaaZ C-terminal domain-containing protein [Enterobacillus tribolii]MBW7983659.1 3-alpha,7-alpha,12-alpha-trihydroxy-5-beta-cholest-24-enoyl-CoA hydratase [Enterobacillus tribolii]RDK96587.1 MaoC dehydratase-like protein [Enterobacillus tribolii]
MALKLDMQGKTYGPFVREYTFRDLILFALGCGAGQDGITDLEYVYEKDLKILPMFAAMPIVDSEVTKTIDYGFDWGGSLHWGFDLKFHQPMTRLSGKLSTHVLLNALYDRGEGRGCLAQHIGETFDETGTKLFTNESWDCALFDGGFGGPKAPKDVVEIPEREPDFSVTERVPLNQALIYRLSGDYHPQHIDWEYAQKYGYQKPILHAVSTAGVACRHIIATLFPGQPERLTRFKTRITKPLYPGATIITQMWKWSENCIHFRVMDADNPEVFYLNFGLVEWA